MTVLFSLSLLLWLLSAEGSPIDYGVANYSQDLSILPQFPPLYGNSTTPIFVGFCIINIRNILAAQYTFIADMYVYLSWRDDRYAGIAKWPGNPAYPTSGAFTPSLEIKNSVSMTTVNSNFRVTRGIPNWLRTYYSPLVPYGGTWITQQLRLSATIFNTYDLVSLVGCGHFTLLFFVGTELFPLLYMC